jgi:DNA-binding transcriptional LysR family regulator
VRLRQVEDFVAVVESGSMRAAARKLGVSQPAITKSIRGLESELHSRLVQRTPHGVVPTQAGRAFLARARVVQTELRKAEEELTQLSGGSAGLVTLGVVPLATLILPAAVIRFRQLFPRAQLRILEGFTHTLLPLVRDETLDFVVGVRAGGKLDKAFEFHPLFRSEYVVVVRKGHPLCDVRSLAELASADWISLTAQDSPGGPLERAFSSTGVSRPQRVVHCDSYHVAAALLAKTDMIFMTSRWMLDQPHAGDALEAIEVDDPMPSYPVGIFRRLGSPLTPLASAMAKATTAAARQLARSP